LTKVLISGLIKIVVSSDLRGRPVNFQLAQNTAAF